MNFIEVEGFRRPISSCRRGDGSIISLSENEKHVYEFSSIGGVKRVEFKKLKLKNPSLIASDKKENIVIFDCFDQFLKVYNNHWDMISSHRLEDEKLSKIKFSPELGGFIVALNFSKTVLLIDCLSKTIRPVLDFSFIESNSNITSIVFHDGTFFFLHENGLFKIDLELNFLPCHNLKEGRQGSGYVREPSDINIIDNLLFINDNKNYLIQVFDLDLAFKFQIGSKGNSLESFDLPISSFVSQNDLYINDKNNDRIIKLVPKDKKCVLVICDKFKKGSLRRPSGIDIDGEENIYISDRSNGVVQIFDKNLNFKGLVDFGEVFLNRPSSVSIINIRDNSYLVLLQREPSLETKMIVFTLSSKRDIATARNVSFDKLNLKDSQDMDTDKKGSIFIADTLNRRIVKTNINGDLISEIDLSKISCNKRILIKTICVRQEDGNVFTADFDNCVIYEFDNELNFLNQISLLNSKESLTIIRGIYVTMDEIFICNRGVHQVSIFDFRGNFKKALKVSNSSGLDWNHPVKIRATNDKIYVADKENDRILSFNKENKLLIGTSDL